MVFQTNPGATHPFKVSATNFEQLLAWSRFGEPDTAIFQDSPESDKAKVDAGEEWAKIQSQGGYQDFYRRAKFFKEVHLVSQAPTKKDLVVFYDSPADDQFSADAESRQYALAAGAFDGQRVADASYLAAGFPKVLARSRHAGDTDTAMLADSLANDKFIGRTDPTNKAQLYSIVEGNEFDVVVRDFDAAVVDFSHGGIDKARLTDSAQNDHFEGHPTESFFHGPGFHFTIRQADEVWITSLHDTDNDTAILNDTSLDDFLKASVNGNGEKVIQWYSPDELGWMLYQLLDVESVQAWGTTGSNKAQVDALDSVLLHGQWQP